MNILLDNNAIDQLSKNINIIKNHPEIQFYVCREVVGEMGNNKTFNPTRNITTLLKVGVKYVPNSLFILGYSKLDGESTFCSQSTSEVYKKIINETCSNRSDAIIAATAVQHNYILLTDDKRLYSKMKKYGYKVMTFDELLQLL